MVNIQNKDVMAEPGSSPSPSSPIYISCVILGIGFPFLSYSFLICKMKNNKTISLEGFLQKREANTTVPGS